MNFDFLPEEYQAGLKYLEYKKLSEIRMRAGFPVLVKYDLKNVFLSINGVTLLEHKAIVCTSEHIKTVINRVTEFSLYAHNDKIKQGYLSTCDGIRIGIAGECVYEQDKIVTIKNVSSLNIRVPNDVLGCSEGVFNHVYDGQVIYNTLLGSPPFLGKTTILKDLIKKLNLKFDKSILVIDERGEFESVKGARIDKIKFCDKLFALNYAVRSLSPEIIVVDELCTANDWKSVLTAVNSGVKIIATCHTDGVANLLRKDYFIKDVFDKYVFLKKCEIMGKIDCVYNRDLIRL